jgi:REP element-mobilizing transposase RayT
MAKSYFNPEIHHRKSIRLQGYDYSRPGWYFVTICLNDLRCMLAIQKRSACGDLYGSCRVVPPPCLRLTEVGKIAHAYWREIPEHFPNAVLDQYAIMPDHIHGILRLINAGTVCKNERDDGVNVAGVDHGQPLQQFQFNRNQPPPDMHSQSIRPDDKMQHHEPHRYAFQDVGSGTLAVILSQYKSSVKRWANRNGNPAFKWQRNYHDHIVRNEEELHRIRRYIRENPCALLHNRHDDEKEFSNNGWDW